MMIQNSPTNVTVWVTVSSPFDGVIQANEGQISVKNYETATLKNAVYDFYTNIQNAPSSPLPFGVRSGSNVMMQGVIEAGQVITSSSFANNLTQS